MTIHVLVEGPSERAVFEVWLPRLLRGHAIRIYPHEGKGTLPKKLDQKPERHRRGLLDQLPAKLRGFKNSLDVQTDRVVVLVDADTADPVAFASSIQKAVAVVAPELSVIVRVAVEETEAFYLGDLAGLKQAFPGADMEAARKYVPDSICRTAELFGQIVGDPGNNKVAWAESMGPVLTIHPANSRSPSFKLLVTGLLEVAPAISNPKKRRPFRHKSRNRSDPSGRR